MSGRSAPIPAGVDPEAALPPGATVGTCGSFRFDGGAEPWLHVSETLACPNRASLFTKACVLLLPSPSYDREQAMIVASGERAGAPEPSSSATYWY